MTSQELIRIHNELDRHWNELNALKAGTTGPVYIAINNAQGELASAMGNLHREIGKAVVDEA